MPKTNTHATLDDFDVFTDSLEIDDAFDMLTEEEEEEYLYNSSDEGGNDEELFGGYGLHFDCYSTFDADDYEFLQGGY